MTTLSAKSHFLKLHTPEQLASVKQGVDNTVTRTAMVYALAQMAEEGHDPKAMLGAARFRNLLLNITEPDSPAKDLPVTALEEVPYRPNVAVAQEKK